MKLKAEVGSSELAVEITRSKDGRVQANVDGRVYDLQVSEPVPGTYLFRNGNAISELTVSRLADGTFAVSGRDGESHVSVIDTKRLRGAGAGADGSDGQAEIKTAMPGKVVRILVEVGAEVEKGSGILIVEAMKMQNEMKAPKAGIVKEIRAEEGSTVAAGDVLAVIE